MASRTERVTITGDVARLRRQRSGLGIGAQGHVRVVGTHDDFTVSATPETTWQLTHVPVLGTCAMYVKVPGDTGAKEQEEDLDYSCDYDIGLVTFDTALTAGHRVNFRYLVTDWLVAESLPESSDSLYPDPHLYPSTTLYPGES